MKFKTERVLEWEVSRMGADYVTVKGSGGTCVTWSAIGGMDGLYKLNHLSPEELSEIARNCAMVWLDV